MARLILASGSRARRSMLAAAGIGVDVIPANVDEGAIRQAMLAAGPGMPRAGIAEALARAKAEQVSATHPEAVVIGSDQILALDDEILEKPMTMDEARASLMKLRGREHVLHSSVALARNGSSDWAATQSVRMRMRAFSEAAREAYLANVGTEILGSVGAYQIEGPGIQLFEKIDGCYFTILGMPLLPLLAELRTRNLVMS